MTLPRIPPIVTSTFPFVGQRVRLSGCRFTGSRLKRRSPGPVQKDFDDLAEAHLAAHPERFPPARATAPSEMRIAPCLGPSSINRKNAGCISDQLERRCGLDSRFGRLSLRITVAQRGVLRGSRPYYRRSIERMAGSCWPMAFDSQSAMASKSPSIPW
jgi:hypothetical protein